MLQQRIKLKVEVSGDVARFGATTFDSESVENLRMEIVPLKQLNHRQKSANASEKLKNKETRQSSCVKARGIPTTAYQVLHLLSCTKGGSTPSLMGGTPSLPAGYPSQVQTGGYPIPPGGTPPQVPPIWPGGGYSIPTGGIPHLRLPPCHLDLAGVLPAIWTWLGYPPPSGPGQGTPIWMWLGYRYPPPAPPNWTWPGYPPLWTDRQTRVKTLPSRRTTYAIGKKREMFSIIGYNFQ